MNLVSKPPRNYIGRVLQALSQLGNALANGNPDVSISARIGQKQRRTLYWHIANWIVDYSFYPLEGPHHCQRAFDKDPNERYITQGHWLPFVILTLIYIPACMLISIFTWTVGWWFGPGRKS